MTKYLIFSLLFLPIMLCQVSAQKSQSIFTPLKIKKTLLEIHQDHRFTFLCHQPFSAQGKIDFQGCTQCPFVPISIQWMTIVSLKRMAEDKICYHEKICLDSKGNRFKGLRCCQKMNTLYQRMAHDLHNLVPEHPSVKKMRGNLNFGLVLNKETAQPVLCHFHIDKKNHIIEPSEAIRGMIARTFLYMRDKYALRLSQDETVLFLNWHYTYPVTDWEYQRNEKIQLLQGNSNPFVNWQHSLSDKARARETIP